jgi:hypothetical protein
VGSRKLVPRITLAAAAFLLAGYAASVLGNPAIPHVSLAADHFALSDTQVNGADQNKILHEINGYRQQVGEKNDLVWDSQLASDAQQWVDYLVQQGGDLSHGDNSSSLSAGAKSEGENLYKASWWGQGDASPADAPSSWYREKKLFDQAPNKSGFGPSNPDWFNWGHYTQMVWSDTTKVGCGTAAGPNYRITGCRFSSPGNYDGKLPYPGADSATASQPGANKADQGPTGTNSSGVDTSGGDNPGVSGSAGNPGGSDGGDSGGAGSRGGAVGGENPGGNNPGSSGSGS